MKRLRLIKVVVQPFFVIDDGEQLTEISANPVSVNAKDWPTYATGVFVQQMQQAEDSLNKGEE